MSHNKIELIKYKILGFIAMKTNGVKETNSIKAPHFLVWGTFLAFLSIVPLFWIIGPPSEPVGDNGCRYWKDCVKQVNSTSPVISPNEQGNQHTPTDE